MNFSSGRVSLDVRGKCTGCALCALSALLHMIWHEQQNKRKKKRVGVRDGREEGACVSEILFFTLEKMLVCVRACVRACVCGPVHYRTLLQCPGSERLSPRRTRPLYPQFPARRQDGGTQQLRENNVWTLNIKRNERGGKYTHRETTVDMHCRIASALAARPFVSLHEVINMDPTVTVLPY
ncbi:hypothetical protein DPX16_15738 [Anabarilius grahami]|uniref:Uncharacterized protein n=1 Tax=Anabarilius grahami TaxID=495550 RepID=A0A3N0YT92_ANAGA|nr:hypothetical protein DPX16_15738 [Anabarilius grahami]